MYVSFLIDNIYVISNLKIPKIMTFLSLKKKMGKFNKDIWNCDQALDQNTDPLEKNRESEP